MIFCYAVLFVTPGILQRKLSLLIENSKIKIKTYCQFYSFELVTSIICITALVFSKCSFFHECYSISLLVVLGICSFLFQLQEQWVNKCDTITLSAMLFFYINNVDTGYSCYRLSKILKEMLKSFQHHELNNLS